MFKIYLNSTGEEIIIEKTGKRKSFYGIYIRDGLFNKEYPYHKLEEDTFIFLQNHPFDPITEIDLETLKSFIQDEKCKNDILKTLEKITKNP